MNEICRKVQNRLAAEGPAALRRDDAAQQHVADCNDCFAFLESLSVIEDGLADLPEHDAPDHVVESLLARPELAAAPVSVGGWRAVLAGWMRPRSLAWGGAAAAVVLMVLVFDRRLDVPKSPNTPMVVVQNEEQPAAERKTELDRQRELLRSLGYVGDDVEAAQNEPEPEESVREAPPPPPPPKRKPVPRSAPTQAAGAMTVVVVDPDGAPLPGATVTMSDEKGLERTTSQLTDKGGKAAFPATSSRGEYSVQVTSPGYGSVFRDELRVAGGKNTEVPVQLVDEIVERVKVTADRRVVDLESTESSTRFDEDFVDDLPVPGRFYQNVLTMAPGAEEVEEEDDPSVHGSRVNVAGPLLAGVGGVTSPVRIDSKVVKPKYPEIPRAAQVEGRVILQAVVRADGSIDKIEVLSSSPTGMGFEEAAIEAVREWRYEPATQGGTAVDVYFTIVVEFGLPEKQSEPGDSSAAPLPRTLRYAREFLEERARTAGLEFQSANGYWANTYVPGDPALRVLKARLEGWDSRSLPGFHEAARQVGQPFDVPDNSALAVYLHADRRGLSEQGRMLLQVGLEGTPRHGGRRPAMNLGIVVDLPDEVTTGVTQGMRALIEAFNRAKQPGDRFRLFVAGTNAVVVDSNEFRHGFLKVTLDRLLARTASADESAGIAATVASAVDFVALDDDPSAPLGTSAVVLITARELDEHTDQLARLAHDAAVGGIPLSVTGVGPQIELAELDRIALAGQGRRRLLSDPADAAALVDRELAAASRAIARAVRLRIRLAPGVKLVEVIGAERLDAIRADRVREAEKSIDLRMSRNLGIQADRGEDEQGIQIVIPSFYAGDSHVILLDVVAPGAGHIADVTVRYKDLVHLRNGVGRASLGLDREMRTAGPLERNVLKNFLALRLSATLDAAGRAVAASDLARATRLIEDFRTLLEGLRLELPGLDNDPEVARDIAMLGGYRDLLASGSLGRPEHRNSLADSLRYAALLKVLPHPLETRS